MQQADRRLLPQAATSARMLPIRTANAALIQEDFLYRSLSKQPTPKEAASVPLYQPSRQEPSRRQARCRVSIQRLRQGELFRKGETVKVFGDTFAKLKPSFPAASPRFRTRNYRRTVFLPIRRPARCRNVDRVDERFVCRAANSISPAPDQHSSPLLSGLSGKCIEFLDARDRVSAANST